KRGEVTKRISEEPNVSLVVAATRVPHRTEWIVDNIHTQRIQWTYGELTRHLTLPRRRIKVINYNLTDSEKEISNLLSRLIAKFPKFPQADLYARILRQRLNSSIYALEQSLR